MGVIDFVSGTVNTVLNGVWYVVILISFFELNKVVSIK